MLPTLAVGWRASVLRCKEAGCFCKVAGVSSTLRVVCVRDRQFNSRQPSGLNSLFRLWNEPSSAGESGIFSHVSMM